MLAAPACPWPTRTISGPALSWFLIWMKVPIQPPTAVAAPEPRGQFCRTVLWRAPGSQGGSVCPLRGQIPAQRSDPRHPRGCPVAPVTMECLLAVGLELTCPILSALFCTSQSVARLPLCPPRAGLGPGCVLAARGVGRCRLRTYQLWVHDYSGPPSPGAESTFSPTGHWDGPYDARTPC